MPAAAPSSPSSRNDVKARLRNPKGFDAELIDDIAAFFDDPAGFIRYAFPWGEDGTPLANESGLDTWQEDICALVRQAIQEGREQEAVGKAVGAIQIAVASGHGIGKTAFLAMFLLWFISTRDFPQIVVTANTGAQLSTKTWRELAKWHRLAINSEWFHWTATRFFHVLYPETWFAAAIPWTEHNSEAFAGTHEEHVLVIFDEASNIADKIWEVTEGAMTTKGAMWVCFGNPTRNNGRFASCFGKFKHRWRTRQIDSRTCKKANKAHIQTWIDDYGEDHDFVRVRVRGMFPRSGDLQFIGLDLTGPAMRRKPGDGWDQFAKVLGVDVARHGDDQTVFTRRQGNMVHPQVRHRIRDLMVIADAVALVINDWEPDAVFVDATGMGWGVIDRLVQMGFSNIYPVQVGEKAHNEGRYVRLRDELWDRGKQYLATGGCIPDDPELESDLTNPMFAFDERQRIEIESKDDMKKRGLPSPDSADSLLLTFASPIAPKTKTPPQGWRERLGLAAKSKRKGSAQAA